MIGFLMIERRRWVNCLIMSKSFVEMELEPAEGDCVSVL